jgi:hypothetical protein
VINLRTVAFRGRIAVSCWCGVCRRVPWSPVVGSFSNLWIDGTGGTRPHRWAVTDGSLPPGMSLVQGSPDDALVRITGTPTTAGAFTFSLR